MLYMTQNKPQDCFLLFLDILGFSRLVQEDLDKAVALVTVLKNDIDANSGQEGWQQDLSGMIFSDSIIFTKPYTSTNCGLDGLVRFASYYQNGLLGKGYLSRGYISRGRVYHDDGIIVGAPLIAAYNCERKIGDSPIVVLDHSIIEEARLVYDGITSSGESHLFECLKQDDDCRFYVDFLSNEADFSNTKFETISDYWQWVITLAKENIERHQDEPGICKKWSFLQSYAQRLIDGAKPPSPTSS